MENFKEIVKALKTVVIRESAKEDATPVELEALAKVASVLLEYLMINSD